MSDESRLDDFSQNDDDRTVTMSPIATAASADAGDDVIALPGDEERRPNGKLPWIITLSVIGALLVLAVAGLFTTRWYFSDKAAPGVSLGQISVAGQDRDRLTDTVQRAIEDSAVTVDGGDGMEVKASLEDLGVAVDVDATVDALLNAKTDADATGAGKVLSDFARLNPFSKSEVGLTAKYDEFTASTFLTDQFVADDQKAVASSVNYDGGSGRFAVTEGRNGRAPQLDAVNKAVNDAIAAPGSGAGVRIEYADVDMPISAEEAQKAADAANQRLDNPIVITNGDGRSFELPHDVVASWIKTNPNAENGTIDLSYDEQGIKEYLSANLPEQLNQDKVDQEQVVDSQGNVMTVSTEGVNGVAVKDTDATAGQVVDALKQGGGATIEAQVDVTKFETKSRTVRYDVPDGDPWMYVNLTNQTATAYRGTTPVRTFNVSTGMNYKGRQSDTGTFFVWLKYEVQTMQGVDDGVPWTQPNVPWVTYYTYEGEAFHGASWNIGGIDSGTPGSHGCINMYPDDAKFVYDFLPMGGMVRVEGTTPNGPVR